MITRRGRAGLLLRALLAALAAAGCDSGDDSSDSSKPADPAAGLSKEPVTITYWTTFAGDEFKLFKKTIAAFEKKYPWVTVKATPGIDDSAKVLAAINGGNPPDLWNYYTPEPVQAFCSNGALEPLDTYVEKTGLDLGRYSDFWVDRLKTDDKLCALPWLADSYGLYYNTDLFKQAGLREPPKTASELLAAAKKLTKLNGDGTIKVAGFVTLWNWYENWSASWSAAWGAEWLTDDGTPAIGFGSSTPFRTMRSRPGRSVTSISPPGRNVRLQGCDRPLITLTRI